MPLRFRCHLKHFLKRANKAVNALHTSFSTYWTQNVSIGICRATMNADSVWKIPCLTSPSRDGSPSRVHEEQVIAFGALQNKTHHRFIFVPAL